MEIIRKLLLQIVDNIDSGISNITEEEASEIVPLLKKYTDRDTPMSKYTACEYIGISRASFDNYIKEGLLPEGKKIQGFKELFWYRKDLDNYIKEIKKWKKS